MRDAENDFLELGPEAGGAIDDLIGHSITYRVAVGPRAGQKVFTLQTVPARAAEPRPGVAKYAGFSLHAGIGVEADQRAKLERLARYVSRPPVAVERLALSAQGKMRYRLKTPYRDGTTHIVLEPLDFIARLAALVPPPPADPARPPTARHVAMNWARRLKRVFGIEIEDCARCGGQLRIIASIEEPEVIAKILAHLERTAPEQYQPELPLGARAPLAIAIRIGATGTARDSRDLLVDTRFPLITRFWSNCRTDGLSVSALYHAMAPQPRIGGDSSVNRDSDWMHRALELAARAEAEGEVPVGALVVRDDQVLGEGWNQPVALRDPTAHAEILALRAAAQKIGDYRLGGATIYVTLEPCPMCAAAMAHARIARLVFGAWDPRQGAAGSVFNLVTASAMNHRVDVFGGVLSEECGAVLKRFFATRR